MAEHSHEEVRHLFVRIMNDAAGQMPANDAFGMVGEIVGLPALEVGFIVGIDLAKNWRRCV